MLNKLLLVGKSDWPGCTFPKGAHPHAISLFVVHHSDHLLCFCPQSLLLLLLLLLPLLLPLMLQKLLIGEHGHYCCSWWTPSGKYLFLCHDHPSAISFFWIHTILHDILGFDTIITRYQQYSMTLDLCKICQKIVLSAWYALVIHTMVHIECIKCIKVAKNMPIHAKGMFLKMQRVKWS